MQRKWLRKLTTRLLMNSLVIGAEVAELLFSVIVIRGEDAELVFLVRSGYYSWDDDLLAGCRYLCKDGYFVGLDV